MKIFIASNFTEFRRERRAAMEAVTGLGLQVVAMEQFGASAFAPIEVCVRAVQNCDVVVALIGRDSGSLTPGGEKSFTQVELETALQQGIPIVPYMSAKLQDFASLQLPWSKSYSETIDAVSKKHMIRFFRNVADLRATARVDISDAVNRLDIGNHGNTVALIEDGLAALDADDFGAARMHFFAAANEGDNRGQRWLAVVELLESDNPTALFEYMRLLAEAANAGDTLAQLGVRAFATLAPAWIDDTID